MLHPTRVRLRMGCGEPLCGTLRRLRELIRRSQYLGAGTANAGRSNGVRLIPKVRRIGG